MADSLVQTATAGSRVSMHQAFEIDAPEQGHYQEVYTPTPNIYQVLCRTRYVGLCGTDHRIWAGVMPAVVYPRVPGHEVVAQVVVDPRGTMCDAWVTVDPYKNCGYCHACANGRPNACRENQTLGVQRDGVLQEYFVIDRQRLLGLPVKTAQEARRFYLTEPLAVANHVLERAALVGSQWCLVVGYGNIGRLVVRRLRAEGARVIVVDPCLEANEGDRYEFAGYIGTANRLALAMIKEATDQEGVAVAFETAGASDALELCLQAVAFGGRVVAVGHSREYIKLLGSDIVFKELEIVGSRNACTQDFRSALALLRKNPQWYTLEEVVYPADRIVEAFSNPHTGKKVVIEYG